jgi:hypothetical protein
MLLLQLCESIHTISGKVSQQTYLGLCPPDFKTVDLLFAEKITIKKNWLLAFNCGFNSAIYFERNPIK